MLMSSCHVLSPINTQYYDFFSKYKVTFWHQFCSKFTKYVQLKFLIKTDEILNPYNKSKNWKKRKNITFMD